MRRIVLTTLIVLTAAVTMAQDKTWSQKMTKTAMTLWPDSVGLGGRWSYDQGVILKGVEGVWYQTADAQYFKYIKGCMDRFVNAQGEISGGYKLENYNIDNVLCGRSLLTLFEVTGAEKYNKAVQTLRSQLKNHPRIPEGGFWHKKIYPNQMWLDGLYMGEPFYTEYSVAFNENNFDDIANQFILMESHARDAKTGLLYHAWDQSKQQKWANKETGLSPHFWGRAMGWYGMALVDVLDKFPVDHPKRAELLAILNRFVAGVQKYQDSKSGVWWQVLDRGGDKGNYLEASASCMFVYALSKAVRQGYIPASYKAVADKGFNGIIKQFISTDAKGQTNLNGTVSVAGLGGNPYRDGSYEYYLSEKVVTNDPKGVGAFILCAVEHERLSDLPAGNKKVVMLDSYFNNEHRNDKVGARPNLSYHYKWEEMDNNGFSLFGRVFENHGFKTATLYTAPTAANLKKASVYVLVDPDFPKENADAKYIETPHIKAVADWVKAGGVLLVFNNDTGNAEFKNLNNLMATFGMQYNLNSRNRVTGSQFEMGAIQIPAGNAIFKTAKKVYVKEISTLNVKAPAKSALTDKGDVIIAVAKYGKGAVFAVGDPWFYNEYTDGRKLPADFENFKAANDLVKWVRTQLPAKN